MMKEWVKQPYNQSIDNRRKYTIDDSVILTIKNSPISPCAIDSKILNKATIYRYINKETEFILHKSALSLAKFYGYEPIFCDETFYFGEKINTFIKKKETVKIDKVIQFLTETDINDVKSITIKINY